MQTLLAPARATTRPHDPGSLPPAMLTREQAAEHPRRTNHLDSLLQTGPRVRSSVDQELSVELTPSPGIFLALRVALLFNAAVGILGFACYEAWIALAH